MNYMKFIGILLISTITVACAKKGSDAPNSPATGPGSTTPGQTTKLCSEVPSCAQACLSLYPYQDPQSITAYYNSRGLLNSSAYTSAMQHNQQLLTQQTNCLGSAY